MFKVGSSIDIHNIKKGNGYTLANLWFKDKYSIEAHSDGDVILHAITNAILGSLSLRDIGYYFSDKDKINKGRSSLEFLQFALKKLKQAKNHLVNVDITVISEHIMISKIHKKLATNLKKILNISEISVKATRWEKNNMQIACLASILISKI